MAIRQDGGWSCSALGGSAVLVEDVLGEFAVDKLQLAAGRAFQGEGADAIKVAEAPLRGLVDEAEGIRGEDGVLGAGFARRCSMYSAVSSGLASPRLRRTWTRDQRERFFASVRRPQSSGRPTSTSESRGFESHE